MSLRNRIALPCLLTVILGFASSVDASRPNIIVFYTDDHGHADLSCQGVLNDIRTPNVDSLAQSGVLARHGYSTAPQCVPSRAGLMVGKFQSRFGVESNADSLEGFDAELTIAERLQAAGYVTAQFGKWHLGPTDRIVEHGFKHVFAQNAGRPFSSNITLDGKDRPMGELAPELYHVDGCSRAAAAVIERYADQDLFLYIAYRAPHVPLDAPPKYLKRFPGAMPERRRQALAMLSAVDDGVGLIMRTLEKHRLKKKTLVFYIGDNGAPLKIHKYDAPGGGPGWDGSLNDPLNGEKGMLAEGGMHVPFVISWPGKITAGQTYEHPVSALDVAATATALAGINVDDSELDGVNLIPFLSGESEEAPHENLMWRWVAQSAIREGKWKLLRGGQREYLYDLETDLEENHDLKADYPEVAKDLRGKLAAWASELDPPGLSPKPMSQVWNDYFDFYLEGKPATPLREKFSPGSSPGVPKKLVARNGTLSAERNVLKLQSSRQGNTKPPFIAWTGIQLDGPVTATITLKSDGGQAGFSWRTADERDFPPANRTSYAVSRSDRWETHNVDLAVQGRLIHLRILMPAGKTQIRSIELRSANGRRQSLWD